MDFSGEKAAIVDDHEMESLHTTDLEWKDFFGSSVSLAGGLLSFYDDFSKSSKSEDRSVDDALDYGTLAATSRSGNCNDFEPHVLDGDPRTTDDEHTRSYHVQPAQSHQTDPHQTLIGWNNRTDVGGYYNHSRAANGHHRDDVKKLRAIFLRGDKQRVDSGRLCEAMDTQSSDSGQEKENLTAHWPTSGCDTRIFGFDHISPTCLSSAPETSSPSLVANHHASPESDVILTSTVDVNDDKKRPLSIGSTSSSSSTSSSLTRHQRKKFANHIANSLANYPSPSSSSPCSNCSGCVVGGSAGTGAEQTNTLSTVDECSPANHRRGSSSNQQNVATCDDPMDPNHQLDDPDRRVKGTDPENQGQACDKHPGMINVGCCSNSVPGRNLSADHSCVIGHIGATSGSPLVDGIMPPANPAANCQIQAGDETNDGEAVVVKQALSLDSSAEENEEDDSERSNAGSYVTSPGCDVSEFRREETGADCSNYADRVVLELLETERAYVSDLEDVIKGYKMYLKNTPELNISKEDIETMFGNIDVICDFNRRFLTCLESCKNDPIQVANSFLCQTDGFVVYSNYCTNYQRSQATLTALLHSPCIAAALRQQQLILGHGLPLASYLLKPVQRILKYHLFLQNVASSYSPQCSGHDVIQRAVESMMEVAARINEMKRQHESSEQSKDIQSSLFALNEFHRTTLGDLILEEKFRICEVKAVRLVLLFRKAILIAKKKEDGVLLVKAFIMSSNLMLIESIPKEPLNFHVIPFDSPRTQYTIQAKNMEQKRLWCRQIKETILDNYNAVIPDKAKEIVMMLGKSQGEGCDETHADNAQYRHRQHCAPEYLERRKYRQKTSPTILQDMKTKAKNGIRNSDPMSGIGNPESPTMRRRSSDNDHSLTGIVSSPDTKVPNITDDTSLSLDSIEATTSSRLMLNDIDCKKSSDSLYSHKTSADSIPQNTESCSSTSPSSTAASIVYGGAVFSDESSSTRRSDSETGSSICVILPAADKQNSVLETSSKESLDLRNDTCEICDRTTTTDSLIVENNKSNPWLPHADETGARKSFSEKMSNFSGDSKFSAKNFFRESRSHRRVKDCGSSTLSQDGQGISSSWNSRAKCSKFSERRSLSSIPTASIRVSQDLQPLSAFVTDFPTTTAKNSLPNNSVLNSVLKANEVSPPNGLLTDKSVKTSNGINGITGLNSIRLLRRSSMSAATNQSNLPAVQSPSFLSTPLFTRRRSYNKATSLERSELSENYEDESKSETTGHRLFGYFNRVYASRLRNRRERMKEVENASDLTAMLKNARPGSGSIGERMALKMNTESSPADNPRHLFTLAHRSGSKTAESANYRSKASLRAMSELLNTTVQQPNALSDSQQENNCISSPENGVNDFLHSTESIPKTEKKKTQFICSDIASVENYSASITGSISVDHCCNFRNDAAVVTKGIHYRHNSLPPESRCCRIPVKTIYSNKPVTVSSIDDEDHEGNVKDNCDILDDSQRAARKRDFTPTQICMKKQNFKGTHNLVLQNSKEVWNGSESESFYEDRLLGDLEGHLSVNCIDAEQDTTYYPSLIATSPSVFYTPNTTGFSSVKERLQSLEKSCASAPQSPTGDVCRGNKFVHHDKTERIKFIVQSLGNKNRPVDSGAHSDNESLHRRFSKKLERDKQRELAICASMTRLRRDSLGVVSCNVP